MGVLPPSANAGSRAFARVLCRLATVRRFSAEELVSAVGFDAAFRITEVTAEGGSPGPGQPITCWQWLESWEGR